MITLDTLTQQQLFMQTAVAVTVANALILGLAYVLGQTIKSYLAYREVVLTTKVLKIEGEQNRKALFEKMKHDNEMLELKNPIKGPFNA